MRAYELDGSGRIEGLVIAEHDLPRPRRGEVLVQMQAASLNYLDLKILAGRFPVPALAGLVPLSDGAGVVVELGDDVRTLQVGDRVATLFFPGWQAGPLPLDGRSAQTGATVPGTLREFAVFEADALVKVPDNLSFIEASTLPCAAVTAWQCLEGPRPIRPGEVFLTHGAGGVSLFAMQFARLAGARVIATASSRQKADRLETLGADLVIERAEGVSWDRKVKQATNGLGADHLVEVGEPGSFELTVSAAAVNAQINMVGVAAPGVTLEASSVMRGVTTLRRISVGSKASFEAANKAIAFHNLHPVIDRVFAFDEAREAFHYFSERGHVGKVVISIH